MLALRVLGFLLERAEELEEAAPRGPEGADPSFYRGLERL